MSQPAVAALYRYPVKSFTPERPDEIRVLASSRIEGDRVLAILLGDAGEPQAQANGGDWWPKPLCVTLMSTPGLALLKLSYDSSARRVRIERDGAVLVDATVDNGEGRRDIAAAVEAYVRTLDVGPDLSRPGRTPLRVVGDGVTPRFQDSSAGRVTLHSRASLRALASALGDDALDELRFRSNIAIDGIEAWDELSWPGRAVRIGEIVFDVNAPAIRCLATHVDLRRGVRNHDMLNTLPALNGHEKPSFAVSLLPRNEGVIRVGDPVELD